MKPDIKQFADSLTLVLNMRLVRRLCDQCKQPYPPNPQLLQKLGIPPGRVTILYKEFTPPPPGQETPEQQKQMKRNKGQIEVCPQCGGAGYFGRMGIFEMMVVNDEIRQAIEDFRAGRF